jgi:O-antigen ligase/predicted Zn-dependent protease
MNDSPVSTNGHRREPPARPESLFLLLGAVLLATGALLANPGITAPRPSLILAGGGLLAILGALAALRLAANRSLALSTLAGLALIAWGATGTPTGLDRHLSEMALVSWVGGLAVMLAFGLGTQVIRFWRTGALLLVLAATGLATFGLWTTMPSILQAVATGQSLPRLAITFPNPDCLSVVLMVALLLAVGLTGAVPGTLTFPLATCSGVLLTALLFTGSRAGVLGLVAGLAIYGGLLLARRDESGRRSAVLGLAPTFLLTMLLLLSQMLTPALGRWSELVLQQDHQGMAMRISVVRDGLKCVAQRTWLGSGPGTFHLAFQEHRPTGIRAYVNVAHNDYMQILVETGVPGLLLFMVVLGLPLLRAGRCTLSGPFPAESAAAAGAGVAVAVYAALNFALPVPADLLWWSAALGLCLSDSLSAHRPRGASLLVVAPAALMLALCGAGALLLGVDMVRADRMAAESDALARKLRWEEASRAAQAALDLEPRNPEHHLRLARLEERQGRLDQDPAKLNQARERADAAHRLSPSNLPVALEFSRLSREAGDIQAAEKILLEMRSKAPNDLRLEAELAGIYLRQGQLPEAARALWRSTPINGSVARSVAVLVAGIERSRPDHGTRLLRDFVAENQAEGMKVTRETITLLNFAREPGPLGKTLKLLIELDPSDTCAALSLADLELSQGKSAEGRSRLLRIATTPVGPGEANAACQRRALERYVALELKDGDPAQAEKILLERLADRPWEGWIRVLLSDVKVAQGDLSGAKDLLQQGLRQRSTDIDLLTRLGELYEKQGAGETALRYYRDALRVDPKNARLTQKIRRLEQKQAR